MTVPRGTPFACVPRHVLTDTRIHGALVVLLALVSYADDKGQCWPSLRLLARDTGLSPGTVRRHMLTLKRCGYVRVVIPGGGRQVNTYRLSWAPVRDIPSARPERALNIPSARPERALAENERALSSLPARAQTGEKAPLSSANAGEPTNEPTTRKTPLRGTFSQGARARPPRRRLTHAEVEANRRAAHDLRLSASAMAERARAMRGAP